MSLVADYGSSSGSSSDSESHENEEINTKQKSVEKLPKPNFGNSSASVFSNPFIEAENAKKAILEKHVKMVPSKEDTKIINGKKICWNYRKGRCRFGHNCAFAHDSDIQKSVETSEAENCIQQTIICENPGNQQSLEAVAAISGDEKATKKKRPGLTQGLIPGKKVMKMFHKQKDTSRSNIR